MKTMETVLPRRCVLGALAGVTTLAWVGSLSATPPTYSSGVNRVVYQTAAERTAGKPLGEGLQQKTGLAQCREQPNIIYLAQDVAAPSVSLDGGLTWYLPHWEGMRSHLTQGVMCDPLDPRRVAVVTNEKYDGQSGQAGLYVSFDGGQTATRKVTWAGVNSVHAASQGIGFNPASESGGKANRWIFVAPTTGSGSFPIHHSTNGMASFSQRTTLSHGTYGLVKHVIGHPTNNNRYLVAFSSGLYWLNNAHSGSIGLQKISGTGGLANGAVNGPPYISSDGQTIVVGVQNDGVYRSTNAGGSWTRISAQPDLHKLFVNWMDSNDMVVTRHVIGSGGTPLFSRNGSTFSVPSSIEKRPGFTGGLSPGYQHIHVAWLNASGGLWYAGRQTSFGGNNNDYRSTDGGVTLTLSMEGMTGAHFGPLINGGAQIFDPDDKNHIALPYIDIGLNMTTDGLKSMVSLPNNVRVSGTHTTVHGAILHPTANRAIIGQGDNANGYLYVYNNGTWTLPSGSVSDKYQGLCYNTDTMTAYGGRLRSTDWLNWSTSGGPGSAYRVVGSTLNASGSEAIFAIDHDGSPKSQNLKRTTNDGTSWPVVLTANYRLMGGAGWAMGPFIAHPTNRDIVYTRNPDGTKIRKWDLAGGSVSSRPYVDLDPLDGASAAFSVMSLAIDPRDTDIIYVRNAEHGTGYKLMRSTDGGDNWTNLSSLVPDGQTQFMAVHPLTGELVYTTASGIFLIDPPYAQSGKLGDGMQIAGNMLYGDYHDAGGGGLAPMDIGSPANAGSSGESGGTYTISGGGADIYGTSDQFHYYNQSWTGDVSIVSRVVSQTSPQTHAWAKAALMVRDDTAADARHVMMSISPQSGVGGSIQMLSRATDGGSTGEINRYDGNAMPYWLRLERHSNVLTGWYSHDGELWLNAGSTTLALDNPARVGLAVTSHDNTTLNTATFDNLSIGAPLAWTAADVGTVGTSGSTAINHATGEFTVNGAGSNIYGSADSFQFNYVTLEGDATIIAEVTGVEHTHTHAKGGLMIRQSLDADAAHATVAIKSAASASPGVEFLRRTSSGTSTAHSSGSPVGSITPPRFLKLVRSGNSFTAYESSTGTSWTQVGATESITMTGTVYVGLVACSIDTGALCTATFESVFVK